MKDYDIITITNTKDKETILEELEAKGKLKTLSTWAQILDKRAYVTIDSKGNLKRKDVPKILPLFAFCDDDNKLADYLLSGADVRERQILEKVDRFSNFDFEKIKENLVKTIFNGSLDFSKRYAKELFLRDREEFYKLLTTIVSVGDSSSMKALYVISFARLMQDIEYNGNILYLLIGFLTKYRDNTAIYENSQETSNISINDLETKLKSNEELLNTELGLGILANINLIKKYDIPNKGKVINKLNYEIENIKTYKKLDEDMKGILKSLI